MGLLDNLNLDDPKTQLLLQMGLGLLGGSGQTNKNFGADLANAGQRGLLGYATAQQSQQKLAQERLQQQLTQLQLGNAQQDFADQQAARDIMRRGMQPQSGPNNTGNLDTAGTPSLYGGQPAPFGMPSAMPQQQPSAVPFGKGVALTNAPAGASQSKFDAFNKYNAIADQFEQNGLLKQAVQYRDLAEKFRPKLKDEQVRLQGGVPVVVRNYEDGSTEVSPFNPTAKTNYINTGGAQTGVDEYTGKPTGATIKNTMSPGDAASNAIAAQRLYYDTGMGPRSGGGAPSAPGGNLPPSVQAQIAKSQAEGLNTGGITYKNQLDQTVNTGNDLMTRIAESRKALDEFKPGMGAEARLNAARAAQMLNAPEGLVSALNGGNVAAKQEFQKLAAQQAMETLKAAMGGTGRITQAEFKVFQANNPNIELDPNAIKKIYDFAQKTHARNVAEQAGLNSYLKEGGNISQWPTEWTKRIGGGTPPTNGFRYLGKE